MKRAVSAIAVLAAVLLATSARADTYTVDGRHTFPLFAVDHYGFSTQHGRFNKLSGKLEIDPATREAAVEVIIDTTSVDMGFEAWNRQMRGENYFNTEKFPTARFVARKFRLDQDRSIDGELTLLGVTKSIVLTVDRIRCDRHPILPRQLCGANLQATIRRSDFGMTHGIPGVSDEVKITIPVETIKDS